MNIIINTEQFHYKEAPTKLGNNGGIHFHRRKKRIHLSLYLPGQSYLAVAGTQRLVRLCLPYLQHVLTGQLIQSPEMATYIGLFLFNSYTPSCNEVEARIHILFFCLFS